MNRVNFSLDLFTGRKKLPAFSPPGNWFQSWQEFQVGRYFEYERRTAVWPYLYEGGQNIRAFFFAQDVLTATWIQEWYLDATLTDNHAVVHDTAVLPQPTHWQAGDFASAKTNHPYLVSSKTNYGAGEAFVGTTLTAGVRVTGYMVNFPCIDRKYVDAEGALMASYYGWFAAHSPIIAGEPLQSVHTVPVLIQESGYTQAMFENGNRTDYGAVVDGAYIVGLYQNDLA